MPIAPGWAEDSDQVQSNGSAKAPIGRSADPVTYRSSQCIRWRAAKQAGQTRVDPSHHSFRGSSERSSQTPADPTHPATHGALIRPIIGGVSRVQANPTTGQPGSRRPQLRLDQVVVHPGRWLTGRRLDRLEANPAPGNQPPAVQSPDDQTQISQTRLVRRWITKHRPVRSGQSDTRLTKRRAGRPTPDLPVQAGPRPNQPSARHPKPDQPARAGANTRPSNQRGPVRHQADLNASQSDARSRADLPDAAAGQTQAVRHQPIQARQAQSRSRTDQARARPIQGQAS